MFIDICKEYRSTGPLHSYFIDIRKEYRSTGPFHSYFIDIRKEYRSTGPFHSYFSVLVMFIIEDTTETVKCRTAIMGLTEKKLNHITERPT